MTTANTDRRVEEMIALMPHATDVEISTLMAVSVANVQRIRGQKETPVHVGCCEWCGIDGDGRTHDVCRAAQESNPIPMHLLEAAEVKDPARAAELLRARASGVRPFRASRRVGP